MTTTYTSLYYVTDERCQVYGVWATSHAHAASLVQEGAQPSDTLKVKDTSLCLGDLTEEERARVEARPIFLIGILI